LAISVFLNWQPCNYLKIYRSISGIDDKDRQCRVGRRQVLPVLDHRYVLNLLQVQDVVVVICRGVGVSQGAVVVGKSDPGDAPVTSETGFKVGPIIHNNQS